MVIAMWAVNRVVSKVLSRVLWVVDSSCRQGGEGWWAVVVGSGQSSEQDNKQASVEALESIWLGIQRIKWLQPGSPDT